MIRVKPRFSASLGGIPPSPVAWLAMGFSLLIVLPEALQKSPRGVCARNRVVTESLENCQSFLNPTKTSQIG
jgi:hypothetical protein